jgi:TRAP-type C4-dicarboxylate transport system permease small subunit
MDNSMPGRLVHGLAKWVAIAGGLVLVVITGLIVVSVVGRAFIWAGLRPISGDYELVEAGVLFAIFAFLPWCHLTRGHAVVGIFTDFLSPRWNAVIELVANLLMLAAAAFILWRHWDGMLDKFRYNETSFILRMPLWWVYAAGLVGAVAFVIVAIWCVARSVGEVRTPPVRPSGAGAWH